MTSLAVQMPAFEEAHQLPKTARAIADQRVPDGVTATYEAWVTRSEDRRGTCSTMQAAKTVGGWDVYEAPAGKLSARNAAHNHALNHGADLICAWDADAPPLADGVLAALVETAMQDGVALANSNPVARDGSAIGLVSEVSSKVEDTIMPHVHGQCHVMTAEAWRVAGPFGTELDESDIGDVRGEEEFDFRRRVEEVGEVVDVPEAEVFNDPRRNICRLPNMEATSDFCKRRGDRTF